MKKEKKYSTVKIPFDDFVDSHSVDTRLIKNGDVVRWRVAWLVLTKEILENQVLRHEITYNRDTYKEIIMTRIFHISTFRTR